MQDRAKIEYEIARPIALELRKRMRDARDPDLPMWRSRPPLCAPFLTAACLAVTTVARLAAGVAPGVYLALFTCILVAGLAGAIAALFYMESDRYLFRTSSPTAQGFLTQVRPGLAEHQGSVDYYNSHRLDELMKIRLLSGVDAAAADRLRDEVHARRRELEKAEAEFVARFEEETAQERACFVRKRQLASARKLLRRPDLTEDQRRLIESRVGVDEPTVAALPVARLLKS